MLIPICFQVLPIFRLQIDIFSYLWQILWFWSLFGIKSVILLYLKLNINIWEDMGCFKCFFKLFVPNCFQVCPIFILQIDIFPIILPLLVILTPSKRSSSRKILKWWCWTPRASGSRSGFSADRKVTRWRCERKRTNQQQGARRGCWGYSGILGQMYWCLVSGGHCALGSQSDQCWA